MSEKLYVKLARAIDARATCASSGNDEWFDRHEETAEKLVKDYMPHGSGIDSGTTLDLDKSTGTRLVFNTSYHHTNENGFYDGWTEHTVTVKPSLMFGIDISVGGRNRNDIKEYLHEVFHDSLMTDVTD